MVYTIKNKYLNVQINDLGAEMISVNYLGKEREWQNEDNSWDGHAPILFPVCGRVNTLINGREYPIPFHGFIKNQIFEVVKVSQNKITLTSKSNEETKKIYPFDYVFSITYSLLFNRINITYTIENNSGEKMYFSCGCHDSFTVDGDIENYSIKFNKKEDLYLLNESNGKLTGEREIVSSNKAINIKDTELRDSKSLVYENVKSRKISLLNGNKKVVEIGFEKYSNIVIWRTNRENMICLEPWANLPAIEGEKIKDFNERWDIFNVEKDKKISIKRYIKYY